MRISYLTLALALALPAALCAQSAPELTEQSVVEASVAAPSRDVQIAQRGDRENRGDGRDGGGRNGGGWRGGNPDNGGENGGWRRRGGNAESGSAPQPTQPQPEFRQQRRFEQPVQPATPQIDRNPFGRNGRDGSTLNTSPPQVPQAEARNGGGFRGDRFGNRDGRRDGSRDDAFSRRFGSRSGNGPQIDTTPQRRPEGQVFDRSRDGRFNRDGRSDVNRGDLNRDNRNGVLNRDWRRDGGRFDGNRDGRFDRNRDGRFDGNRNGTSNNRFERQGDRWVDRGNRFGNNNRDWNRDWRGDRRYNWQGYRNQYRNNFRQPRYYNPYGYGYGYQRFGIGIYLNSLFFSNRYWINDPYEYRLPAAPYGYRWIRYYDDVLLVDQRNGYVFDVIHNFFW